MKIELKLGTEKYEIEVEPSSFTAYKLGTNSKSGTQSSMIIGYFSSLTAAVKKISQSHLSELDEVVTLKQYADRVDESYKKLMEQLGS